MSKAKKQGFPPAMGLIEVQKIREEYRYVLMKRALKGSIKNVISKTGSIMNSISHAVWVNG